MARRDILDQQDLERRIKTSTTAATTTSDGKYVLKAGDTMTGLLTLNAGAKIVLGATLTILGAIAAGSATQIIWPVLSSMYVGVTTTLESAIVTALSDDFLPAKSSADWNPLQGPFTFRLRSGQRPYAFYLNGNNDRIGFFTSIPSSSQLST